MIKRKDVDERINCSFSIAMLKIAITQSTMLHLLIAKSAQLRVARQD